MATQVEEAQRDAFAERLFGAALGAYELMTVHLGDRLGYYRALAEESDGLTSAGSPRRPAPTSATRASGSSSRRSPGSSRSTTRGRRRRAALLGFRPGTPRSWSTNDSLGARDADGSLRRVLGADAPGRRGGLPHRRRRLLGGVRPSRARGPGRREPAASTPTCSAPEWLPAVADVHARLLADPPARVADVACGAGWSSIAIARAYPNVDRRRLRPRRGRPSSSRAKTSQERRSPTASPSISATRATRSWPARTSSSPIFEAVHDMSRPVEVLRSLRGSPRLTAP